MSMTRLEQQMKFIIEIDKLKSILRQNYLADASRREDDAQHSWYLAMLVITLAEHFPDADTLKTLQMVLIHDLVEIDAGDTFLYDEAANRDKAEREQAAALRIFGLLPPDQAAAFRGLWQEFEEKRTAEAIFAAVVDRLAPITLNVQSGGLAWKNHQITADRVLARNQFILEESPAAIGAYVRDLLADAAARHLFYDEER
jgi:putative hydrolases of HD superfamily